MNETQPLPTDAAIDTLILEHGVMDQAWPTQRQLHAFARAVLAKWGQPQAVAVGEPSASLAEWRRLEYIERAHDIAKGGRHGADI